MTRKKFDPTTGIARQGQPAGLQRRQVHELEVGVVRAGPWVGVKVYRVAGREVDTDDTLEADGLIRRKFRRGRWVSTLVLQPDDPRVMAWQLNTNVLSRARGQPPVFPDLDDRFDVIDGAPKGNG